MLRRQQPQPVLEPPGVRYYGAALVTDLLTGDGPELEAVLTWMRHGFDPAVPERARSAWDAGAETRGGTT